MWAFGYKYVAIFNSSKRIEEERAGRKVAHNKLQIIIFTHLMRNN